MQLSPLQIQDLYNMEIGTKFYKMVKLRVEFIDSQFTLWDSGVTKTRGLIVSSVEKIGENSFKITGGQFNDSEQTTMNIEQLHTKNNILMYDRDELIKYWVENATKTIISIEKFISDGSNNAIRNIVWASNHVNTSKDNRPELWV